MRSFPGTSSVESVSAKSENMPVRRSAKLFAADATTAALAGTLMWFSALRPAVDIEHRWIGPLWLRLLIATVAASTVATRRLVPLTSFGVAVLASIVAWMFGFERDGFLAASLVLYVIA